MKSPSTLRGLALFGSVWLSLVVTGCTGQQMRQPEADSFWSASQSPQTIVERQLDPLLAQVSQLQLVARESLDAARLVGTPDHEPKVAQQAYTVAEQLLREGKAAHVVKHYELSWEKLRAADVGFRRAEEAAVRAGLGQLEAELIADYGRLLNPEARRGRPISGAARVNQGIVDLRDGAGRHFGVSGKA